MAPRTRVVRLALCLAVAVLVIGGCSLVTRAGPARDLPTFEAQLEQLRRDLDIPGMSAAIASGQRIVWSRGFGLADVERAVPAADTTSYHLASLTKTFASTIVMQLVEAGELDLEAPVANFGIVLPSPGVVRVKHLLTHTSEGDPGAAYSYNGDRFALLDRVIAQASGESFGQLLVQRILTPLQLMHTAPNILDPAAFRLAGLDSASFAHNLAQGYTSDGRTPLRYPGSFSTAAGLIGSAIDVARYSMAIDRNAFLRAETQARVFAPTVSTHGDTLPYGLGWFVQHTRGVRVEWHYGYWTGNSSLIVRVPDRGLTFVLLANSDALSRNTRLGAGDLLSSPAARLFLDAFVFGTATLLPTESGLWDAHTHLSWSGASALDSLVAHGVVAVRDCGGDAIQLRAWRDSIAAGQRRGPRIYYSGPVLDGQKTSMRHRVLVTTPERAAWVVDSLALLGVSFIKTHNAIPPAAFFAVIREARRHHLRVAAHLPRGVPAWVAADSGVGSLEHAAESMLSSPLYAGYAADLDGAMAWWRTSAGDSMLKHLARSGVVVTPTLVAYQRFVLGASNEEDRVGRLRVLDFLIELTGKMHRAGIPLLAGSDFATADSLLVPGTSLRLEIGLLERAGLSHAEAVAAASTAVATWLGAR